MFMENDPRLVFTISEVAKLLNISRGSAYQAARTGQIPTLRFGKLLRVPRSALQRLLGEKHEQDSSGQQAHQI